jgi:phosphonate ABC transporter permease subunit PhnE
VNSVNSNAPSSRSALRRLLIVLAVAMGVLLYAYGWQVTNISLEETQDPIRQDSVQRALRELLSPDIFDQDRESMSAFANFQIGCADDAQLIQQPPREDGKPYVVFSPDCGVDGDVVTVEGFDFHANSIGQIRLVRPSGQKQPFNLASVEEDEEGIEATILDIDGSGHFKVNVRVPRVRGDQGDIHEVETYASWAIGPPYLSEATHTVIEKIIETIFLALMATSLAVPIAAVLSFVAARNLMREVRLSLGDVLVALILLPIGGVLGAQLLGPIGRLGAEWGKGLYLGIIGPIVAIVAFGFGSQAANKVKLDGNAAKVRTIIINLLLLVVLIFTLGAIGGLGVWLGELPGTLGSLEEVSPLGALVIGAVGVLGNFVGTLGTLVDLGVTLAAGLAGAFLVASIGMDLTRGALRRLSLPASRLMGGVLGLGGGGLLLGLAASLSTQAALLGLFPPVAAAILGGQIVIMIYNRWFGVDGQDDGTTQQVVRTALYLVGAVAAFALTYYLLDVSRAVIDGRLPSTQRWQIDLLGRTIGIQIYIAKAAIIGAALGGIGGGLAGTRAVFPVGMLAYNATRTILNALRAIEPLIMGIVFVIWVGIGPFAGVLALTLHSVAALGKLYSEQIENIDAGPIEAIQATGANRLQTIIYAVVPQIVPPYTAFTMYRWDINVRMSTIIGFVGGGGIGFLLQQQINLLRYRGAGVAVLAIAIVVSALDYASATIRERMV